MAATGYILLLIGGALGLAVIIKVISGFVRGMKP